MVVTGFFVLCMVVDNCQFCTMVNGIMTTLLARVASLLRYRKGSGVCHVELGVNCLCSDESYQ